jgi:hypothetical protein
MTPEHASSDPTALHTVSNGDGNVNGDSSTIAAAPLPFRDDEPTPLDRRLEKLAKENRALQEEAARSKRMDWLVFAIGFTVMGAGALLVHETFELRAKTLKHGGSALGHSEFIAGIAGGCLLILAVVGLAALWLGASPSRQSTL